MAGEMTLSEVSALLAAAQDHALGQPPGAQLRATVLGQHLGVAAGSGRDELGMTWWTSALRFLGCTGHAFDMAVVFGDEIEMRAASARCDFSNPFEVIRVMVNFAGPGEAGMTRLRSVLSVLAGGKKAAEMNFRTACEVADVLAKRLGVPDDVLPCLRSSFERWNGRGLPNGVKGVAIPRPMRMAQLSQDFEILARIEGVARAVEIVRARRGRAYDPELADLVIAHGTSWWTTVEDQDPWDAALAVAPPCGSLDRSRQQEAFLVLADFADLKSPWTGGHSREVARLAGEACGSVGSVGSGGGAASGGGMASGGGVAEMASGGGVAGMAEMVGLVHDLGRVSVPNTIWDKPGALTRDERDRAETHALVTDQLLRRIPFMASLANGASAAHERVDGSGYHRRVGGPNLDQVQRVVAAADCYQAMVSDRPYRPAHARSDAARMLREMVADGRLDGESVERVLSAAGHPRTARVSLPAGLTSREVDVLRLVAVGTTTREMADQLVISPKTADRHVQNIYRKIGVSTRGAATLFAVESGLLVSDT